VEYGIFILLVVAFSTLSCLLTLTTKTVVPSTYRLSTLDEDLGAEDRFDAAEADDTTSPTQADKVDFVPPMIYYSAAGSGVAEVRVILSGFVLHGFLGLKTLIIKTLALVLSVASGLSLGKEGPFVHIATCVGNIACRLFSKYDNNDGKRREVLSAAAASGVAVAFGAPIGGVLFSLEEVAYFFPAKTLFRTFFCCICAALTLKFLNPYGNNKIVIFEVRYLIDWEFFELAAFILVGIIFGAVGALFIKASKTWAQSFRKIPVIRKQPLVEVMLVALVTGIVSFWNPYTKIPVAKLLFNLASPCDINKPDPLGLCPESMDEIFPVMRDLAIAFFIKGVLTIITFGIVSYPEASLESWFTNNQTESSRRNIRPQYGMRCSRRSSNRPLDAVDRAAIPNLAYCWKLCCPRHGSILHQSRSVCPHCSRVDDVWGYEVVSDSSSYSFRTYGQSALRASLLSGYPCRQMDCGLYRTS
jgi:chloride channel 3/4/5